MATLESLALSITQRSYNDLNLLLTEIRANRRRKPEPKKRKTTTARSSRKASKSAPKQQDLFALANGMSQKEKDLMAATLLEMLK